MTYNHVSRGGQSKWGPQKSKIFRVRETPVPTIVYEMLQREMWRIVMCYATERRGRRSLQRAREMLQQQLRETVVCHVTYVLSQHEIFVGSF